jgi:hypothetical protein
MQAYCFHMNEVYVNRSDEDEIYPLTTKEIAEAQWADASLKQLFERNAVIDQGSEIKLIENTTCVCKDGWLVIPKPLQVHAVKWYPHYLQHPGHTCLKEMMNTAMYWKGMRTTIRSLTVVNCLDMYRTNVLMYRTMDFLARPTKGQMLDV